MTWRHFRMLFAGGLVAVATVTATTVGVRGDRFLIDGHESKLWGIRVASASQTEELTVDLIAQLDDYRAHGLNALTVFYQGSNGACSDPFSADGTRIDPAHQARLERIIAAADARGMVVIVGVFYQLKPVGGVAPEVHLRDWPACLAAVRTVTAALRGRTNVILNMANEQNSRGHADHPWAPVRTAEGIIAACAAAKAVDPERLVGGGGYDHALNAAIGRDPAVDVLLFDTLGPDRQAHAGHWSETFVAQGVTGKPFVNVEMFGNWTGNFKPAGVYPPAARAAHFQEVEDALAHPALSVFFHSNLWCQGGAEGLRNRYDLGGDGTAEAPGIRWYADYLQARLAGRGSGSAPADAVAPTASGWTTLSCVDSPHARHECGFVGLGDAFYLLGGRRVQPVDRYDPETGRWTALPPPPQELHHFQPVTWRGRILVAGAMTGRFPHETPLPRVLLLDPATGQWSDGPEIPTARRRGGAGCVVVGDTLYLVAGITDGHWGGHVAWVDAVDLTTGVWRQLPDAPRARDHFQAAVLDGQLFAVGGRRSSAATHETFALVEPAVDVFDLARETWTTWTEAPLPTPRAGSMTAVVAGQLVVAGGESLAHDVAHAEVEVLDPLSRRWHRAPDLAQGRHGTGLIVWQGGLHVAAGCGQRGGRPELATLERLPVTAVGAAPSLHRR